MTDATFELSTAAVANASLMLTTHLLRFLRESKRLSDKEITAIYEATLASYDNPVLKFGPQPPKNWHEQIRFILNSAVGEALR